MTVLLQEEVKKSIRAIPDFPKKGIIFRDITPLLLDREMFRACIDFFVKLTTVPVDYIVSIESRGFILGSALAYALGTGFIPIRKEGKLPYEKFQTAYALEYGEAVIEIHVDAMKKGSRVLIVDDVLATGGTVCAATRLVEKCGAEIAGYYFLIELAALGGREKIKKRPVHSLISY